MNYQQNMFFFKFSVSNIQHIVLFFRRCELTKEAIGAFKQNEDMLKLSLELLNNKLRYAEERYEHLQMQTESKLAE